jgi:hypothetical protein
VLLDTIERCDFGFGRRCRDVRRATSCECDACERIAAVSRQATEWIAPAGSIP